MAERTRVSGNLPRFTGKRGEDVREWLFQIEIACRINSIQIDDTNTRLPGIAGSAMDKPASGWFLHWSPTTRLEEHTWGIFREHVLRPFEASNYQAALREKLQRLKQKADIETYNGEYSALIFRVEGMSMLDQVLCYANGLKSRSRSYVKLEKPETLSAAMDLAVKYEGTHFVDDARDRQAKGDKKKSSADPSPDKPKGKPFGKKGRHKAKPDGKRAEGRTCFFCKKPGHIKANCFAWKKEQGKQENNFSVLRENPLVYKSRPLFSLSGEINVNDKCVATTKMLLDCGATTIYASRRITIPGLATYTTVAFVYAIPDEFDCILGIPVFEDMQPQIDWRGRRIEGTRTTRTLHWERTGETCEPIEESGPVISSGLRRSVEVKDLSAKRPDPCRGAALETDVKSAVEPVHDSMQKKTPTIAREQEEYVSADRCSATKDGEKLSGRDGAAVEAGSSSSTWGKDTVVEKMFTMGVTDDTGVQTKYITRKKLRKFLRIKTKSIDKPDFMLVLTNNTIKKVARALQRRDQPDNVGTAKAQRYLETDWDSFQANPAFDLLTEYKDSVFRPELPEGLPERRESEHRIDVKDPNLAMYRQQWRQSPKQQREIVRWVEDMVKKKLIRPSISPHAAPTFCVRKPVEWRIVHDYRYLNSNTIRQSIPMTRKEDILDAMAGGYWYSTMANYASLTASMFTLLKKKSKRNAKIHFDEEQSKNFKELKRRLCNLPVLYLPDFDQPMRLRTDASKFAVGGVLFQVVDGIERPIAYTSRKMKSAELNYPTQQQELLAIVHALAAFRIYCLDKPPIVETDHKSLEGRKSWQGPYKSTRC
ncbi:hypothetical protein F444_01706 [Phytophthora nicotianae P1976]|uniref:CCHC-type domain-containing protein n=1 Tax=Phytophthora nicotianae P1976 TaxID=1317066 RepID=A0A081AZR2_PHYNI|nr:hypothetical protein F444_01706 [Phytophthora nicotianae P1976]